METEKNEKQERDMLRSISEQSGEGLVSPEEEKEGYGGKDTQKKNVLKLE